MRKIWTCDGLRAALVALAAGAALAGCDDQPGHPQVSLVHRSIFFDRSYFEGRVMGVSLRNTPPETLSAAAILSRLTLPPSYGAEAELRGRNDSDEIWLVFAFNTPSPMTGEAMCTLSAESAVPQITLDRGFTADMALCHQEEPLGWGSVRALHSDPGDPDAVAAAVNRLLTATFGALEERRVIEDQDGIQRS